MKEINAFLDRVVESLVSLGKTKMWPANPPRMDSYWCDTFVRILLEKTSVPSYLWPDPGVLVGALMNPLIPGLKVLRERGKITQEEIDAFLEKYFAVLRAKTCGDLFERGKFLVTPKPVQKADLQPIGNRKLVGTIHSMLYAAIWATHFDPYFSYGCLVHGPYPSEKGLAVVREFHSFNEEIWEIDELPKVITVCEYPGGVEILLGGFLFQKTYCPPIRFWSEPGINELSEFLPKLEDLVRRQRALIDLMKPEDIILKSAEINCNAFRSLLSRAEMEEVLEAAERTIEREGLKYWKRFAVLSLDPKHLRRVFDPKSPL